MGKIRTLYATYGYTGSSSNPDFVNLYRDRAATYCVATVPVSAPHAPTRKHTTFNHPHTNRFGKLVTTSFALEWID